MNLITSPPRTAMIVGILTVSPEALVVMALTRERLSELFHPDGGVEPVADRAQHGADLLRHVLAQWELTRLDPQPEDTTSAVQQYAFFLHAQKAAHAPAFLHYLASCGIGIAACGIDREGAVSYLNSVDQQLEILVLEPATEAGIQALTERANVADIETELLRIIGLGHPHTGGAA